MYKGVIPVPQVGADGAMELRPESQRLRSDVNCCFARGGVDPGKNQ